MQVWDLYCEAGAWSVDLASAADIYCYSVPTTASTGGYTEISTYWPTSSRSGFSTSVPTTTGTTAPTTTIATPVNGKIW